MQYWTVIDGERKGPVTLEQLISLNIQPNTLVWREGLTDWIEAKDLSELTEIFAMHVPEPPEISNKEQVKEPEIVENETPPSIEEPASQPVTPPEPTVEAPKNTWYDSPRNDSANPWYPSSNNSNISCPPTYLALAIVTIACCFQPCGIVSLVYASLVKGAFGQGKYDIAQKYSHYALIWGIVGIAIGCILTPIVIALCFLDILY